MSTDEIMLHCSWFYLNKCSEKRTVLQCSTSLPTKEKNRCDPGLHYTFE